MTALPGALAAEGLVCLVGAGGKKTTLYALAARLDRAVVTSTVRIPPFEDRVAEVVVTDDPVATLRGRSAWPVGLAPEREREDRYRGYAPETVERVAAAHDGPVLVKADGARSRWLKAPDDREPQLPRTADTVIPVASARVVGEPLDGERVHRPERVAAVAGLDLGETLRPHHVAAVLASDRGGLKGVPPGATVVPLVNMVDDAALERVGREIAAGVHERADVDRVVLARMDVPEVVAVVT